MPTLVAHRSSACSARILSKVHDLVITLGSRKLLPNTCLVVGVRGFKTDYPNLVVSFWYVQMPCVTQISVYFQYDGCGLPRPILPSHWCCHYALNSRRPSIQLAVEIEPSFFRVALEAPSDLWRLVRVVGFGWIFVEVWWYMWWW